MKRTLLQLFCWKKILFTTLMVAVCGLALFAGTFLALIDRIPIDFSLLERYQTDRPSILLDDEGKEWGRFQLDRREPIPLDKMPDHLINAFIAAEDWHFFEHAGISLKGIIRSALINAYNRKIVQGASTITQQLVKLLFFDSQRTLKRKIREQFYALAIERQFSKEQILEVYLNHVYFGAGIYGVEAAAQRFWNSSACDLTPAQSAVLAGVVRSPGHYCPLWFPLSAAQRRNVVLMQMNKRGFIDDDQWQRAKMEPLNLVHPTNVSLAPHWKETLRIQLEQLFGKKELYSGGLQIKTTLNKTMQQHAQQVFDQEMVHVSGELGPEIEGALLSMEVKTGQIKAMVGGRSFQDSQFNRAMQALRQQGSVFKPVLYTVALLEGMSFLDTAVDEPLSVRVGNQLWEPRNHTMTYEGQMTLARALSYSNNIISAKVILALGPEKVVDLAKRLRIKGQLLPYPSLALGCVDSTVYEVTGMFNVFANNGIYVRPHSIQWVKDQTGKKIYRDFTEQEQVIPSTIVQQVAQVLSLGLERRKKGKADWLDSAAINKTGTTNDSRTCWFAGSTPEITTVVYVGFDDNRAMGKNVFPLYTAYPIWYAYHKRLTTTLKEFAHDSSLYPAFFDIKTGKPAAKASGPDVFALLV